MPAPLVWVAQLMLGWSMGAKFSRTFFTSKPWFLAAVAGYTILAIGLSAGLAWALAQLSGRDLVSLLLGTIPGGVGEMALTASALHFDVAQVTTLHLVRVFTCALFVGLIFRFMLRLRDAIRRKMRHASTHKSPPTLTDTSSIPE